MEERAGAQVLGEGNDVTTSIVQIAQRLVNLVVGLAHTQNQVGLGDHTAFLSLGNNIQGTLVTERRANLTEDTGNGLQVVREHLRLSVNHLLNMLGNTLEVGDEHLNAGVRAHLVNLTGGLCVQPRTAVFQIITSNTGHGCVTQTHDLHVLSNLERLSVVNSNRLAGRNIAEVATAGALGTTNQVGCLTVFPALVNIGAASLFTHGVQALTASQLAHLVVFGANNSLGLNPVRLLLNGNLSVAGLHTQ